MKKTAVYIFILLVFAMPAFVSANGGDQRIVESKYVVNFARAPFTPIAGEETSFVVSFFDYEKNFLVQDDLIVNVFIRKQAVDQFIFKKTGIEISSGVAEFKATLDDPGLHEVFYEFRFKENPEELITVPDYLLDVKAPEYIAGDKHRIFYSLGIGLIVGVIIGFFTNRKYWLGRDRRSI